MTISSQATKEINLTLTLLIVTVVAVTMKRTSHHAKYGELKSLHDMAYYK